MGIFTFFSLPAPLAKNQPIDVGKLTTNSDELNTNSRYWSSYKFVVDVVFDKLISRFALSSIQKYLAIKRLNSNSITRTIARSNSEIDVGSGDTNIAIARRAP